MFLIWHASATKVKQSCDATSMEKFPSEQRSTTAQSIEVVHVNAVYVTYTFYLQKKFHSYVYLCTCNFVLMPKVALCMLMVEIIGQMWRLEI